MWYVAKYSGCWSNWNIATFTNKYSYTNSMCLWIMRRIMYLNQCGKHLPGGAHPGPVWSCDTSLFLERCCCPTQEPQIHQLNVTRVISCHSDRRDLVRTLSIPGEFTDYYEEIHVNNNDLIRIYLLLVFLNKQQGWSTDKYYLDITWNM